MKRKTKQGRKVKRRRTSKGINFEEKIIQDVSREFLNKKARGYWINFLKTVWHHSERDKPRGLFDFLKHSYKDSRRKFGGLKRNQQPELPQIHRIHLLSMFVRENTIPEELNIIEEELLRINEENSEDVVFNLYEIKLLGLSDKILEEVYGKKIIKPINDIKKYRFRILTAIKEESPATIQNWIFERHHFGKKKIKRKGIMKKEKISSALKKMCKKHKVRLTVKRNGKRVYKSVKVLKKQCANKKKKSKRKFGAARRMSYVRPAPYSFGNVQPFGYTRGRRVRFGSRRPEFHYPEYTLMGYNTAKTDKIFRK